MDKQNESTCCICLENENILAMFCCHFCNEGIICLECIDPIEENNENEIIYCPICRSGFFHKRKTDIIKYALNYLTGIKNNNNLITRWIHNYSQTDEYIFFNS